MRSEQINFAFNPRFKQLKWMILAAISVICTVGLVMWALEVERNRNEAEAVLSTQQAEQFQLEQLLRQRAEQAAKDAQILIGMDKAAQAWLQARSFSWDQYLIEVESIDVPGAKLHRLNITPEKSQIQLELNADAPGTVLRVLKQLNEAVPSDQEGAMWSVQRMQQSARSTSELPVAAVLLRHSGN